MENARSIYWYLFWDNSIEFLNDLVTEAFKQGNFERVKLLCKVIALKSMGMTAEEFWLAHLTDLRIENLLMQDAISNN